MSCIVYLMSYVLVYLLLPLLVHYLFGLYIYFFLVLVELLNYGFEGERSSTSALGALALPYKVLGGIIALKYPSEGALPISRALALPLSLLGSAIAP
jgi:hypothetical protein